MAKRSKRGQTSGLEVSILIILIALFIGGYVILLPPEEREELLGELEGEETAEDAELPLNILLSETPGEIVGYRSNIQKATLEPMHLYIKDETETETLIKSLTVSKTLIKDNYKNILFNLDDLEGLNSAKISFMVEESKGSLIIKLNGHEIYEGELTASDLPIDLPKAYLKEQNTLELSTSSPGWKLFSSHHYLIKDFNLITSISIDKASATRAFSIDTTENDVRKAELSYFVNCNKASEGELTILFNNRQVFEDRVFCQYLETRELTLPEQYFTNTRNTLEFEINEGDYNIDEIELQVTLDRSTYPSFSFEVSSTQYNKINNGEDAVLYVKFPTSSAKRATVYINDNKFDMYTAKSEFKRDVSSLLKKGTNNLIIEPEDSFDVDKIEIKIE